MVLKCGICDSWILYKICLYFTPKRLQWDEACLEASEARWQRRKWMAVIILMMFILPLKMCPPHSLRLLRPSPALPSPALPSPALPSPAQPCTALPCLACRVLSPDHLAGDLWGWWNLEIGDLMALCVRHISYSCLSSKMGWHLVWRSIFDLVIMHALHHI